ncbi:MAG TPA: pseudouridine synthase [Parvularculaceae bacterium]|nr:pseudouridine synthase [Parvularculaceae bacterium]
MADAKENGERIAKFLARAGIASRREAERLIEQGIVTVNGEVLTTPAFKVVEGMDVRVDGARVRAKEPLRLWRYHKPAGLVTTHNDPQGRPTVFDAVADRLPRVISVGRLDLTTEGLLLLTNDGALARQLELPANAWTRRYRIRAFGRTTQAALDKLSEGISIDGVEYKPIKAKLDQVKGGNVWITASISEGKNREIRKVMEHLGLKVNRLIRTAFGPFQLGALAEGSFEEVPAKQIKEQLGEKVCKSLGLQQ